MSDRTWWPTSTSVTTQIAGGRRLVQRRHLCAQPDSQVSGPFTKFVDIDGDIAPNTGTRAQTVERLYGGNTDAYAEWDPTTLITENGPTRASRAGSRCPSRRRASTSSRSPVKTCPSRRQTRALIRRPPTPMAAARALCGLGVRNGIDCAILPQPGKHDWPFAARALASALPWLAGQIGTRRSRRSRRPALRHSPRASPSPLPVDGTALRPSSRRAFGSPDGPRAHRADRKTERPDTRGRVAKRRSQHARSPRHPETAATSEVPATPESEPVIASPTVATPDLDPGYTAAGVPTLEGVREKIEKRYATALGAVELAADTPEGRTVAEQYDARAKAAAAKLDEIRAAMQDPGHDSGHMPPD